MTKNKHGICRFRMELITISKNGKFTQPRAGSSDKELEQAFEQVTAAANGGQADRSQHAPIPKEMASAAAASTAARQKKIIRICLTTVAVALIVAIVVGTVWFLDYTKDDGRIYGNVYVLGIDLGGMTPEEASAAIHAATDGTYRVQNLTIQLPDNTVILTPSSTSASLDVDAVVEQAYNYGRDGSRWENTQAKAAALLTSYTIDVSDHLLLNTRYLNELVTNLGKTAQSVLTQPVVTVTGQVPDLGLSYEDAIAQTDVEHMTMSITLGTPQRTLDTEALMEAIMKAYTTNNFDTIVFEYQQTEPDVLDLQTLFTEYCVAPVDSELDTETWKASQESLGYGFDLDALQLLLDQTQPGETLECTFGYLPCTVTKADLEANLFKDVLGSSSTYHTNNSNRNTNLRLACAAINGTVLSPGETFSFNGTVGQRTEAKGYKPAGAYVNGETVDSVGGGICQVASTLYYSALKADLQIVERINHGFAVGYLPFGMDATVSWGGPNFRFRNNTDYPIMIRASVSGGQVHISLVGTDTKDYYIKMTYETVDGPHSGGTKYKVYEENNSKGYKDGEVIQSAYTGRTVKTYRCRYSKATDELISSKYEATSTYKKRDEIICIIGDPTAPTDSSGRPIETTTEPTTDPSTDPSTDPTTVPPTDPTTAPPTEPSTEPPTTAPPTEPPTDPTTAPTEPSTDPSTEPSTEAPSDPTFPSEPSFGW